VRVDHLTRSQEGYILTCGKRSIEAEHVVVAMADYQAPVVPGFARDLDPEIVQFHSSAYRNPSQLQPGSVLIVGAGNSGAEIAYELAAHHRVHLAGRDVGEVPFSTESFIGRNLLARLVLRLVFHRILTLDTPIGRRARSKLAHRAAPL